MDDDEETNEKQKCVQPISTKMFWKMFSKGRSIVPSSPLSDCLKAPDKRPVVAETLKGNHSN